MLTKTTLHVPFRYTSIFNEYNSIRDNLLEPMPVAELKATGVPHATDAGPRAPDAVAAVATVAPESSDGLGDLLGDLLGGSSSSAPVAAAPSSGGGLNDLLGLNMGMGGGTAPPSAPNGGGDLMDLLGMGMGAPAASTQPPSSGGGGLGDLGDLLGGLGGGPPAAAPSTSSGGLGDLGDLLGGGASTATAAAPTSGIPSIVGWEKNGLSVKFDFSKNPANPSVLQIMLTATNSTSSPMGNYSFQIAVPKTHQLQMQQQSAMVIPPSNSGVVTTPVLVNNPQQMPIRMRVKVTYDTQSGHVEEMGEIANFPPNAL